MPKDPTANLRWRQTLLRRAVEDEDYQASLYTASAKSILFWINSFVWTYQLKRTDVEGVVHQVDPKDAHVPFVTWGIQDQHLLKIEKAISIGYDLLTDKSRDMGATWDHIVAFMHKWLFETDRSFLMISRKEPCVDSPGRKGLANPADPGTLFGKIDYLFAWLPEWMRPTHTRTTMHFVNLENGSRIDGESANATAGSSDRRTAILLDEMAKMQEGASIKRSTRDVTACRLANSTSWGAGTAFTKWRFSGTVKLFIMPWWEHPEKGLNREIVIDPVSEIEKIESPWHRIEATLRTPKEMASEVDMNHIGSGDQYFESDSIIQHRKLFVQEPIGTPYLITFKHDVPYAKMAMAIRTNQQATVDAAILPGGPWKFWMHLVNGRPDQNFNYVFGIDIGKGMGASNSVISVGCVETHRKIAEFASAKYAPHEFAQIAAASAIWFGGSQRGNRPFIVWESNGDPGIFFGKVIIRDLKYPSCYLDRHIGDKLRIARPKQYGWHSSSDKKALLLNEYRRALAYGTIMNPSEAALAEAESYVYLSNGGVGPAELQEESTSARKTHGDRVIADALMFLGLTVSKVNRSTPIAAPYGSIGERYRKWQDRRNQERLQTTFDFRSFTG